MLRHLCYTVPLLLLATGCDDRPAQSSSTPSHDSTPAPAEEADVAAAPATKESAFDSNQWNSAVGLGGGAGGRYGGRSGAAVRRLDADNEAYAAITQSGFLLTEAQPLSTFAADVDTASFTNVHRMLSEGRLPPTDAVRLEEFVNACRYQLPAPEPREAFAVESELTPCPWQPDRELVRFSLNTRPIDKDRLPPCNFVFLIDVSGSMRRANKLPLWKKACDLLIDQLRPQDRVSIVTYASGVRVPLESASGSERGKIRAAVQALRTSGGTNGQGGIQAAYELAQRNQVQGVNRVLLATDGDFNVGIRSPDALEQFIAEKKEKGVFLTVLGFGGGNLKDDRLERLANRGNGNYHYIDSLHTARRVLVEEFGAEMMTVAKDVKLQTEWNPQLVKRYRLLGYENRALAARDFRDDHKDGGEMGAGHDVTALYEIERVPDASPTAVPLVTLRVRYKPAEGDTSREAAFPLAAPTGEPRPLSTNGRIAALAAAVAMQLRNDEHKGSITPELLAELAAGVDRQQNAELVELVERACKIIAAQAAGDEAIGGPEDIEEAHPPRSGN